jgi:hypothetical protein
MSKVFSAHAVSVDRYSSPELYHSSALRSAG